MIKITVALYIAKILISSFDYKESAPTSLFPYNYAAIDYLIPGIITNPAYLPLVDYSYINFSMDKPYSLEGITSNNLRIGSALSSAGFQMAWSRFGINQYRENILEVGIGYLFFRSFTAGIGFDYYNISINTDDISFGKNLFDIRISLLFIPFKWINISFQQENVLSFIKSERNDLLFPVSSLGISIRPIKGFSIIWNINRTPYGFINSFSVSATLLSFISIKGGYSRETTTYSAAFSFVYKYISISYGLRFHSYLGCTHSIGCTLTRTPQHFNSLTYHNRFHPRGQNQEIERIDINRCTLSDLKNIPVLSDIFSKRIMKYREMIGPVTKKSLLQIGMNNNQVNTFLEYIYGLERDAVKNNESKNRKYLKRRKKNLQAKRRLFQELLNTGLNATTALNISELIKTCNRKQLFSKIDAMIGINKQIKRKIKKICAKSL